MFGGRACSDYTFSYSLKIICWEDKLLLITQKDRCSGICRRGHSI